MSRAKRNAAAEDYLRRAPNYSAEAVAHLDLWAERARASFPVSALLCSQLARLLESSHKFALPTGGLLFDETGFSRAMIETFNLPFNATAFEFAAPPMEGTERLDRFHAVYCPKRIALCVDAGVYAHMPPVFGEITEPSCLLFYIAHSREWWTPPWVCVVVPYMQKALTVNKETLAFARREAASIGLKQEDGTPYSFQNFQINARFAPFGDLGASQIARYGPTDSYWAATVDTRDELNAAVQACAALACTNVTTEVIRPNREARAIRPASTLFDYHILTLDHSKGHPPSEDRGGSHASPRTHLRRGHIRRLAWGPRIWVNSCVVNPSAIGTVNKDYAIRGPR